MKRNKGLLPSARRESPALLPARSSRPRRRLPWSARKQRTRRSACEQLSQLTVGPKQKSAGPGGHVWFVARPGTRSRCSALEHGLAQCRGDATTPSSAAVARLVSLGIWSRERHVALRPIDQELDHRLDRLPKSRPPPLRRTCFGSLCGGSTRERAQPVDHEPVDTIGMFLLDPVPAALDDVR